MLPAKIRVLSDQTINKIAAGEVIEHPASVVKELVENALDAGATQICVEIQEGGRQLIRVSDNGCGMTHDDALLCLERHATSKIREVEDIQDLLTMGFRGEAIPSIAAISKFTLHTCPRTKEGGKVPEGTFLVVEGGKLLSCDVAPRAPGTTIEVKTLFFNVPVRRKFQKSPTFDVQEILKMLGLLALGYPTIQFELLSDQKQLLKTSARSSSSTFHELLENRLEAVFGQEYPSALLPLKFQQTPFELEGFIGNPTTHKPNRTGQHLFINQRLVTSPLVAHAVREGYGTMLPTQRYPLFVLHLRLPGSYLDVNVHPQKKEVRLRQEQELREMIIHAIQTSLRQEQGVILKPEMPPEESSANLPPWSSYAALLSPPKSPVASEAPWEFKTTATLPGISTPVSTSPVVHAPKIESSPSFLPAPSIPKVVATLLGYCLIDPFQLHPRLFGETSHKREGGLALIDQRAAYARIYYEKLLKHAHTHESQSLLLPVTLHLTVAETQVVQEHLSAFNQMGFGLREFGHQAFVVDSFPTFLKQEQLQTCLSLIIQDLVEMQASRRMQTQKQEHLALSASRASLPNAKQLSLEEAQGLVQQLIQCESPAQCPFGKPICLYLAPDEIAKWFQK